MGKLYEIENISKKNPIIKPKPECYIIKPLKTIIDTYPEDSGKIMAFLHFMNSYRPDDNPYADVPYDEREEDILRDLDLDIDTSNPIIKDALLCVQKKYETTFYILFTGIKEYLNKMGKKLKLLEPTMDGKDANSANVRMFIKEYSAMSINFKSAFRDFDEEAGNSRNKGGGRSAYDENEDDNLND